MEDTMRNRFQKLTVVLAILLTPTVALAAGDNSALITTTIFHAINLAILIGLLVAFARKPLNKFLADRKAKVTSDLEEAARLREEASALLAKYETQVSGLDAERDKILADYRRMGETERDRIIAAANKEADRIARDTETAMTQEITRAKVALEAEVVELAGQIAERTLREQLDARGHAKLVDSYLAGLDAEQA
jgi:F-type H+-transporting ATPase subunit b